MQIELNAESLELILNALKDHVRRRKEEGMPSFQHEDLIAELEIAEREVRRGAGSPAAGGTGPG